MITSWGQTKKTEAKIASPSFSRKNSKQIRLPFGRRRSYGDSCLLHKGLLIDSTQNDYLLSFNREKGILKACSGLDLDHLLKIIVPAGWFLPVSPGTKFVTLGGAVANDIHGKNHHQNGNFGHWVRSLVLIRSNGEKLQCSDEHNPEFFRATIGGLGLTGYIDQVEIQLIPIESAYIEVETIQYQSLDEFFEINRLSKSWPYTVAWSDFSDYRNGLRGLYIRGRHSSQGELTPHKSGTAKSIPFNFPGKTLNPLTISVFNKLYFGKNKWKTRTELQHYDPFFYPLDSILHWNRIYGENGFFQFQCVVPHQSAQKEFLKILQLIAQSGQGSFLTVLKTFGDIPSKGLLSFPSPGITLCMDFANLGRETVGLMLELERLVREAGGKLYPAKDALMSEESFKTFFPQYQEFLKYKDPLYNSDFWKRVGGDR